MFAPCLALVAALAAVPGHQDPAGERAREILSAPRYQTELPTADEPRDPSPPPSIDGLGAVFWILLGVAIAAGLFWLLAASRGHHRDVEIREAHGAPARASPAAAFAAPAVHRVEELARAGRFGEAIRLLLQLTFDALPQTDGAAARDSSLTSREIAARTRLPAASLVSLRALVDAVERSLFARREPDQQSFQACMREYEALVKANGSTS